MPWMQIVVLAMYVMSPLDLIPDPMPVVGNLDDLVAMWMLVHRLQEQFRRPARGGDAGQVPQAKIVTVSSRKTCE